MRGVVLSLPLFLLLTVAPASAATPPKPCKPPRIECLGRCLHKPQCEKRQIAEKKRAAHRIFKNKETPEQIAARRAQEKQQAEARLAGKVQAKACADAPDDMSCVPGGLFLRGLSNNPHNRCFQLGRPRSNYPDTVPEAWIWVQTFYMDKYEVTYGDYMACVKAGKCNKAGPRYSDFDRPKQPVAGVSWFDAVKYCQAHGKHLPTEAQWEKAARGTEGNVYPWGNEPADCERAVIRDKQKGRSCGVKKRSSPSVGRVLEVGSRPAGIYGLFDMVGNVEEWTWDWYTFSWLECGEDCLGIDPKGPCGGKSPCPGMKYRSVRGGSWYWPAEHITAVHRRPHIPRNSPSYHHFGFRCAASVEEAAGLAGKK